jgi:negative regulator of sigma-B (phosphoserine phosphatase)
MAAPWLEVGVAARGLHGDPVNGDGCFVQTAGDAVVVAVMDGLGHGPAAADAVRAARQVLGAHVGSPVGELVLLCHAALARTRGVVMSLARVRPRELCWVGVGNVEALVRRPAGQRERILAVGGIVGQGRLKVRERTVPLGPGDLLVMATDGIRSSFVEDLVPGGPQEVADRVLERHSREDDALVLVAAIGGAP